MMKIALESQTEKANPVKATFQGERVLEMRALLTQPHRVIHIMELHRQERSEGDTAKLC